MKLTSADIIKLFIPIAVNYAPNRWEDDPPDLTLTDTLKGINNVKLWKRMSKSKLKKFESECGSFLNNGWEFITVLDSTPLTDDCICRHFVNDIADDGLDPLVVTDPTDTKILQIGWHCD